MPPITTITLTLTDHERGIWTATDGAVIATGVTNVTEPPADYAAIASKLALQVFPYYAESKSALAGGLVIECRDQQWPRIAPMADDDLVCTLIIHPDGSTEIQG